MPSSGFPHKVCCNRDSDHLVQLHSVLVLPYCATALLLQCTLTQEASLTHLVIIVKCLSCRGASVATMKLGSSKSRGREE